MDSAFEMDSALKMDANTEQLQIGINSAVRRTITPTATEKGYSLTRDTKTFRLTQEIADEAFQWLDARVNNKALFFGKFKHFPKISIIDSRVTHLLPKKGQELVVDLAQRITLAITQSEKK